VEPVEEREGESARTSAGQVKAIQITAATTLIPTATGMDQKRTTFHARTMRATHVPMSQKYVALAPGRFTVAPHGRCDAGASRGFR
jgi:hypothetical protein